jgi:hypothetical protein
MTLGGLLALAVGFLATGAGRAQKGDEDEAAIKEAREAIVKMVETRDDGAMQQQAAALAKKVTELNNIMQVFKPRKKNGLGVGPKGDGIELKIISMSKRTLPKGELTRQQDDLIRMAEVSRAVSEVAIHFTPKEKQPGKDPADWKKYTEDMKQGSLELIKAVKSGDPKLVRSAATNLNASCTDCHSKFRDEN